MTVSKTWRAPDDVYEQLREFAFWLRKPSNQIITEAVREWIERHEPELQQEAKGK